MRIVSSKWFLSEYLSYWVHPSVNKESDAFSDHARFIGFHVIGGCVAMLLLPILVIMHGSISPQAGALLGLLSLPLFLAWFVSKTAQLQWALRGTLVLCATAFCFLCLSSGNIASPFLIWFCILSIESALLGGRGSLLAGLVASLAGALLVAAASFMGEINFVSSEAISQNIAYPIAIIGLFTYVGLLAYRLNCKNVETRKIVADEKDKFQLLAENTTDLITRHNSKGETVFSSPAARRLLGIAAHDLLHFGLLDKVHVQDRVTFLNSISTASHMKTEQSCTFRLGCKLDGVLVWKWVEMRSRPLEDKETGQVDVVSVTRDVTAQKQHEDALLDANQNAEQCNSVQRDFLTTMSHELRTPLNSIVGFSDILKEELFGAQPNERCREYVELIHSSGEHLLSVVNDLLNVSRIEAGKYELSPTVFAMSDVVEDTVSMLKTMADKAQVHLTTDFESDLPEIYADQRSCQQILINLVSNAIKFSALESGKVSIALTAQDKTMRLAVRDNGIGMSAEFVEALGTPFMQADTRLERKFEGSGLGMSVVMGLVDLHEGTVNVDSVEGQGTCVTIELPLKSQTINPVPADVEKQIVLLNQIVAQNATLEEKINTNPSKGDSRARLSA